MKLLHLLCASLLPCALLAQAPGDPPSVLPAIGTAALSKSVAAAARHTKHVWRDSPPVNDDGSVNAYIEIPRGERRKWEFDMAANARAIDRVIPVSVGGYPVNYGIVPQTVSYDGDPFDVLVLGPALPGASMVRGVVVGVMFMEDEKGLDSKVVLSLTDRNGKARHQLTAAVQQTIGDYFKRYKLHEPGKFSKVPGWGTAAQGLAYVKTTHAFFEQCRQPAGPSATSSSMRVTCS